ncbi:MAG: precorrin-3B C(17)-methyltransferase, partial [Chloroflexi bacterium]|nr:precorrin-3B C(17)-methyltransferase [Chloroflexota bacterium]
SISLSDLLTPWATIRKRVEMAALGDFVIALYNPKSRTRTWQLAEVREVLLNHRRKDTPVGIVRNAYRPDQSSILTTLDGLIEHYDSVDMFTTVIIGNSTTYTHDGKMITPRGYQPNTSYANTSDANNNED